MEILVIGDSHAEVFNRPEFNASFPGYAFDVTSIIGATVSGLENPNSQTQALSTYKTKFENSRARYAIVMLGEVDTGFVIWYRAQKYQASVEAMMELAIQNYQRFLKRLSSKFNVICISAPLPTIKDGTDWGDVANARKEITATLAQRTQLTLEFNRQMQDFCRKNKINYLMLDDESLDHATGMVKRELLNRNPADHHYDPVNYAELLIGKLRTYII